MSHTLYASTDKNRVDYENFIATCPSCERESIFNRISDLKNIGVISNQKVTCQQPDCGCPFDIGGDLVCSPYEMLILDCVDLLQRKKYMSCILNLAQAHEVFFNLFLRVELVYKPFGECKETNLDTLEELQTLLFGAVKRASFHHLRCIFLKLIVSPLANYEISTIKTFISDLDFPEGEYWEMQKKNTFATISDEKLQQHCEMLYETSIVTLRNKVVHGDAFRPCKKDARDTYTATRKLLFGLSTLLDIKNDIYYYRNYIKY